MRKIILSVFLISILISYIFSSTKISLEFLTKPDTLVVSENIIYISNFPVVYLLSPESFNVIKQFGKKGEGPEEFKQFIRFHLDKDHIVINSSGKMSYYSKDGDFLNEKKLPGNNVFKPVGENYAGYRLGDDKKTRESFVAIDIFDHVFKKLKEIHKIPFKFQFGNQKIHLVRNQGNFRVWGDKIFVNGGKSEILLFSSEGEKIRSIKPDVNKVKITETDKIRYKNYYKNYPEYKQYYDAVKEWFTFPKYFPSIHEIYVSDNRIYAETHEKKNEKRRFLILNFKGDLLGSVWLKVAEINPLEKHIYTFHNNKFYQLVDNEESEQWELHIEELVY